MNNTAANEPKSVTISRDDFLGFCADAFANAIERGEKEGHEEGGFMLGLTGQIVLIEASNVLFPNEAECAVITESGFDEAIAKAAASTVSDGKKGHSVQAAVLVAMSGISLSKRVKELIFADKTEEGASNG